MWRWVSASALVLTASLALAFGGGSGTPTNPYLLSPNDTAPYADVKVKTRSTGCVQASTVQTYITAGQSKGDNVIIGSYANQHPSTNLNIGFFDGGCWQSGGGLLGNQQSDTWLTINIPATCTSPPISAPSSPCADFGWSYWTAFADFVLNGGSGTTTVIIIPLAFGSTTVANWAPGGYLSNRFQVALQRAHDHGLTITGVLWDQGEQDCILNTPRSTYSATLGSIRDNLTGLGITVPMWTAITALHTNTNCNTTSLPQEVAIVGGQQDAIAASHTGGALIKQGANLDSIPLSSRDSVTGVHFTNGTAGTNAGSSGVKAACLWAVAMSLSTATC